MRKGVVVAAVAVMALLSACKTTTESAEDMGNFKAFHVKVGDRKIPCIGWTGSKAGSITCDWKASGPVPEQTSDKYKVTNIKVGDREVPCIFWAGSQSGGVSCDWSASKR